MHRKFSLTYGWDGCLGGIASVWLFHVFLLNCCSFLDSGALAAETVEAYLHLLNETQHNEVG